MKIMSARSGAVPGSRVQIIAYEEDPSADRSTPSAAQRNHHIGRSTASRPRASRQGMAHVETHPPRTPHSTIVCASEHGASGLRYGGAMSTLSCPTVEDRSHPDSCCDGLAIDTELGWGAAEVAAHWRPIVSMPNNSMARGGSPRSTPCRRAVAGH